MREEYRESYSDFNIIFGGENEIDATLLIDTMKEVVESLQYITTKIEPGASIKVNISSFQAGSFEIKLKTIVELAKSIPWKENLGVAATMVTILKGSLEIKKHLKGKRPKKVEYKENSAIIINKDSQKLETNKAIAETYLNDSKVDKNITNIFNIVNTDGNRNSVIIKQGEDNIVEIKSNEFVEMSKPIITDEDLIVETLAHTLELNLLLKKPDLIGRSKWDFILDKTIPVSIADEEWLREVNSGRIKLSGGVKIPVKLHIENGLDKDGDIIDTKYTILKVTGDVIESNSGGSQLKLF